MIRIQLSVGEFRRCARFLLNRCDDLHCKLICTRRVPRAHCGAAADAFSMAAKSANKNPLKRFAYTQLPIIITLSPSPASHHHRFSLLFSIPDAAGAPCRSHQRPPVNNTDARLLLRRHTHIRPAVVNASVVPRRAGWAPGIAALARQVCDSVRNILATLHPTRTGVLHTLKHTHTNTHRGAHYVRPARCRKHTHTQHSQTHTHVHTQIFRR